MPLYEYECQACGHRFEVIQKRYSDPPIETCVKCGGPVEKLVSSPAIQFKGSGWYITDYARAGKTDGSPSDSGAKTEQSDSKSESKSDAKADAKADAKGDTKGDTKGDAKSESKSDSKTETKSESKPPTSPATS
jgi:putative FmdB family regulatory protein